MFNEIDILGVSLDKFNIDDDNNSYEDYRNTTIHVKFWPCLINLKNAKPLKKIDKELMPVTLHPTRWWIGSC